MNVLVDTNVLISAVIRDRLPPRVIDEIVSRDDWFWIVTAEIETEYREVLASDADYLITGDKDLLDEQPLDSTQILRPADFAHLFAIA